ncbi:MAG: hypothetical protein AAFW46_18950, partial [Pseudomonadota bacterium]
STKAQSGGTPPVPTATTAPSAPAPVFALLAGFFAAASFANGRLVMRFGMRRLATVAMALMTGAGALGAVVAAGTGGVPPLWAFVLLLAPLLMAVAVLFANVIALAVEPLGHVAGTATSVVLATATLVAAALGSVIASFHDATVLPLFAGFAGLGLVACLLFAMGDRSSKARRQ